MISLCKKSEAFSIFTQFLFIPFILVVETFLAVFYLKFFCSKTPSITIPLLLTNLSVFLFFINGGIDTLAANLPLHLSLFSQIVLIELTVIIGEAMLILILNYECLNGKMIRRMGTCFRASCIGNFTALVLGFILFNELIVA